jgi:tRNA threonylcarbamoyl adenosine modification protein (Sua5/YciO/YrdC/YwlC family)
MAKAIIYKVYPDHPEAYKMTRVAEALREGALVLYPTDTVYGIGCDPRNKPSIERLRAIKGGAVKLLTLICPSLADVSTFAYVDDAAFKLMKALTPGPFTFILKGTKEVPKLVLDPKRKTAGLRVPDYEVCQALLERLGHPLVSTSARLPEVEEAASRDELYEMFEHRVDAIIDDGMPLRREPSTMIDLTTPDFEIIREGMGMEALLPYLRSV